MGGTSSIRVLMISVSYPLPNDPSGGVWLKNQIGAYADYVDICLLVPVHMTPSFSEIRQQRRFVGKLKSTTEQMKDYMGPFPAFSSPVRGRYVRYFSIPPKQVFPFSGGILLALRLAFPLLRNRNFEVIHAQGLFHEGLASVLLGKVFRRSVLVTAIGSDIHGLRKGSLTYRTTLFVLRRATLITTVSGELRERVIGMGIPAEKVIVVPNGVDSAFANRQRKLDVRGTMNIPAKSNVFGFVGRMIPVKDPLTLTRAFAKVLVHRKDAYLIFVGDGELRGPVLEEAERLGIIDHVRFTEGMVSPDEMPSYMHAFDYLCVSSVAEGWPNVILEAMVCGKPVIGTRVGGVPEAINSEDYGLLVPPQDPAAMADAMRRALDIPWNREEIAQYAKQNSWKKVGAKYYEIYRELCFARERERF